jgi:hypothetical protein
MNLFSDLSRSTLSDVVWQCFSNFFPAYHYHNTKHVGYTDNYRNTKHALLKLSQYKTCTRTTVTVQKMYTYHDTEQSAFVFEQWNYILSYTVNVFHIFRHIYNNFNNGSNVSGIIKKMIPKFLYAPPGDRPPTTCVTRTTAWKTLFYGQTTTDVK